MGNRYTNNGKLDFTCSPSCSRLGRSSCRPSHARTKKLEIWKKIIKIYSGNWGFSQNTRVVEAEELSPSDPPDVVGDKVKLLRELHLWVDLEKKQGKYKLQLMYFYINGYFVFYPVE